MVKFYPSRPPRWFSRFNMFHVPHIAVKYSHSSVAVGSNEVLLSGRLGVSHIMYISREDYLSLNNTSGPPLTLFSMFDAPYHRKQLPVPQWPVGSNGGFPLAAWEYHT